MKAHPKPTAEQLATMTPVEIDTELYRLDGMAWTALARLAVAKHSIHEASGDRRNYDLRTWPWVKSYSRALADANRLAEHGRDDAWEALDALRDEQLAVSAVRKVMKVYEDEFDRRGGWTRAFLAQSYDGHVHNGQECSTCHHGEERTRFTWMVAYSGKDEAEIIKAAGVRACTTCYPDAPTADLKRPTVMFTEDEIEAQAAREQRAADKAKRDADKTAKGITTPDGGPLRDKSSGRIATERTAVIEATDALSDRYKNLRAAQIIEADPGLAPFFLDEERRARNEAEERSYAMRLIAAIAHKRGTTGEEVLAELEPKAYAKAKRDMGGDWPSRIRYSASFQREEYDAYLAQCEKDGRKPWEALTLRWFKL